MLHLVPFAAGVAAGVFALRWIQRGKNSSAADMAPPAPAATPADPAPAEPAATDSAAPRARRPRKRAAADEAAA
ncbi:hypothetical protein [Rubrivivax gelatinosus]|uniref:Uncharacterized protein n=1 Tax=Rubrivivax gelatinosus TaxID=28068 RepID=A0A4R2M993_RUBGE|nr:hypothetical protein [Rubrivivax gelatinosus]MBK1687587.1 hypothetical protein [Rubrivivax gelatinosus]TCP02960.1 hypothetical protein EV684_105126 [Rubrivivax gelatinosus]